MTEDFVLVKILCKTRWCGKLLYEVRIRPAAGETISIPPCPEHHGGGGWDFQDKRTQQRISAMQRQGRSPQVTLRLKVAGSDLLEKCDRALATATTQVEVV